MGGHMQKVSVDYFRTIIDLMSQMGSKETDRSIFPLALDDNKSNINFYVTHPDWVAKEPLPQLKNEHYVKVDYRSGFPIKEDDSTFYRRVAKANMDLENCQVMAHWHKAYKVKNNTPWHVNDPAKVIDSNVLYKRHESPVNLSHLKPWNKAREVLYRELALPPIPERMEQWIVDYKERELAAALNKEKNQ